MSVRAAVLMGSSFILVNAAGGPYQPVAQRSIPPADTLHGRVEVVLGAKGGVEFGDVTGYAILRDGRLLVADRLGDVVRIYDSEGMPLGTVGGRGDGPNELRQPCCVTAGPSGESIWVMSKGHGVVKQYREDASGRWVAVSALRVSEAPRPWPVMFVDDSLIAVAVVEYQTGRYAHILFDGEGGEFARVFQDDYPPPPDSVGSGPVFTIPMGGGRSSRLSVAAPFSPRGFLVPAPDGRFARGVTSSYRITVYSPWGDPSGVIEQPIAGRPLTAQERDAAEQIEAGRAEQYGRLGASYPHATIPNIKPVLSDVWFDRSGRLWVRRRLDMSTPLALADVYDQDGSIAFIAEWPKEVSLGAGAMRGSIALGVMTDSVGVETVAKVVFR